MESNPRRRPERVGPTTRVAACCLFVFAEVIGVTGRADLWMGWLALLLAMAWVSGATLPGVLRRMLPALPFILAVVAFLPFFKPGPEWWVGRIGGWRIAITEPGMEAFWLVGSKSLLAIAALAIAGDTTSAQEAARALRDLRVPGLLVLVIALALRHLGLMREEASTLMRARELRRFGRRMPGEWSALGNLVGTLFARTLERADRVHRAMRLRGFAGEYRSLHSRVMGGVDVAYLVAVAISSLALGGLAQW